MNVFFTFAEKYPLECVFVYDIVSPNVSLFSQQACDMFTRRFRMLALNTMGILSFKI